MRIVFINPRFPPSLWDFAHCRDIEGSRYTHPPLALPTLAALTPPEHHVRLVDENVEELDFDEPVDLVGITGYWIQRDRVFEIADRFRARKVRVAIGGPIVDLATLAECKQHADHVFWGEAEYTWPRFLVELAAGAAAGEYAQRELVDMRDSPLPRFDLLRRGAYSTATVETSRGCPMSCEFCEIPTRLGQRARNKSLDQVMAEVRAHHSLGADSIFFIDDHFIGNRGHARALLKELARFVEEIGYSMYFTCQFTINLARDREMLELLRAASFRRVFVGIETPRKESLLHAKKKQNVVGDLVESVHLLQAHGITVWAGMILGFDEDDARVFEEQRAFLQEAGIPVVMSGLLQAIPGTPLYDRIARAGRLRETEMAGVRGTHEALLVSNIQPVHLTDEQLIRGYQTLIRDLYEYEPFAERLLASIQRGPRPPARRKQWRLSWNKLLILMRLVRFYVATLDTRRRRMFFRVIIETAKYRRDDLETALMHLVVYKHLRLFYRHVASLPLPQLPPGRARRQPAHVVAS